MSQKHITLAMSGGVDSSAAALLLRQAGYDLPLDALTVDQCADAIAAMLRRS